VGDGYAAAMTLLENAGYDEISYFLDRRRHSLNIADARASLVSIPSAKAMPMR
jgi:hypothetical protein